MSPYLLTCVYHIYNSLFSIFNQNIYQNCKLSVPQPFFLFFTDFYSITISVKYNYHISKSVNLYNISAQSANNATNFSYILFKKFIIAKKNQGIGPLFPASGLQQDLIYRLAVQIFYLGKTYSANKASIERLKDETNLRN